VDYSTALQVLALREVIDENESPEYRIRKILRWYSKTFVTPLHIAEELPLEDILQHYYECNFEEMSEAERVDAVKQFCMTPEQRLAVKNAAEVKEEEFFKELEAEAAAQAAAPKKPKVVLPQKPLQAPSDALIPPPDSNGEISMQFVDLKELEALAESDGLGDIEPLVGLK
jgi:hypothetical protein